MNQIRSSIAKNIGASALAFVAVGLLCSQVNGQSTIAYWTFDGWPSNQSAALPGGNPIPVQIPADTGSGAGSSFVYTSPDHTGTSGTGIKGFVGGATGTTVNTPVFDQNGVSSLNLLNGTTTAGQALIGNGEYLDVAFPMSGQSNIGVSFATLKSSAAAFNSNQWSYSTDGT